MPILRMGKLAAYGRAQENGADRGGQQIAAAAGYDPYGFTSFLKKLDALDRLRARDCLEIKLPAFAREENEKPAACIAPASTINTTESPRPSRGWLSI